MIMSQTLQQLYGANAVLNGTTLTINLDDFANTGFDPTVAANLTPGKIAAAHLKFIRDNNKGEEKANNPAIGIVADDGIGQKQFLVRGEEPNAQAQISIPMTFNIYTLDEASDFDPDKVIG